ncbi:KRAB-A domain-containing protein 2 [Trichinella sp. T6]|nr:KRAB-A domain-containing protein 2 [Trichinella sp. T6]
MVIQCSEGNSFSIAEIRAQLNLGRRSVWLQSCCAKHDFRMRDVLLPKRARKLPKSPVVKPLVSTNLMSRAQVDLINFQTISDGDFKYIMTYLNHFAKFCILSPLKSKRAEEVASKLLEIFLTFGAPSILQSDNGREFSYVIIAELKTCWPELKLVTGRPRHPQSQGAVERLNGVVQDKLAIWMRENGCKRWSMGLKFVQWQINVSIHETTGQSPFKVTFGEEPRIGLESYVLPKSLVDVAKTEEEI